MNTMCPVCGKVFEKRAPGSRYCSNSCRAKAAYMRSKAREVMPDMPRDAFNLLDAFARLRYVESDFARLAAAGDPRTRAIAKRVCADIAATLRDEGML